MCATVVTRRKVFLMAHTPCGTESNARPRIELRSEEHRGVYVGNGDSVVGLGSLAHFVNVAAISHRGVDAFSVWSVDCRGEDVDLLVNTSGEYSGVVPLDFSGEPAALRVSADGDWAIEITPLNSAEPWDGHDRFEGSGDRVLLVSDMTPESVHVHVTVDGGSSITVWSWGDRRELLVSQVSPSVSTVEIPDDAVVLVIQTDGGWSMAT